MAKVLITGFTAKGIGSGDNKLNIATSANLLPKALKLAGHEVIQKPIIPGDDVSEYDNVFVFMFPPNSLPSAYTYGAMYTLAKRPDAICALDDWQTKDVPSGFATFAREGHWRLWKTHTKSGAPMKKRYYDQALDYKQELNDLCTTMGFEEWPYKCLAPVYRTGNIEALGIKAKELISWDPTPICDSYMETPTDLFSIDQQIEVKTKEKKWVYASLIQKPGWLEKTHGEWEVQAYGNKNLGQERISEHELYKVYQKSWGVLVPPHYHTLRKSGWWRVRYGMIRDAECVTVGDPTELSIFFEDRVKSRKAIELMSDSELKDYRDKQLLDYEDVFWSKEELKNFIIDLL